MVVPEQWMVYFMENRNLKWMMTGVQPYDLGFTSFLNKITTLLQIHEIVTWDFSDLYFYPESRPTTIGSGSFGATLCGAAPKVQPFEWLTILPIAALLVKEGPLDDNPTIID